MADTSPHSNSRTPSGAPIPHDPEAGRPANGLNGTPPDERVQTQPDEDSRENAEMVKERIRKYQAASTDAMTDVATGFVRAMGEVARGVRKAVDRF